MDRDEIFMRESISILKRVNVKIANNGLRNAIESWFGNNLELLMGIIDQVQELGCDVNILNTNIFDCSFSILNKNEEEVTVTLLPKENFPRREKVFAITKNGKNKDNYERFYMCDFDSIEFFLNLLFVTNKSKKNNNIRSLKRTNK